MVALFAACDDDYKFDNELDTVTPQGDVTLTAEANTTDFAAVGGSGTITITSSHTWEATSDEDWVTFPDPATGDGLGSVAGAGNAALPFDVEGRKGEIRTAYITLTSGNKEVVLTITQTGTAPGAAELKGSIANEYPDTTITLTAKIPGATHFIWFIDGVVFDTTTKSTYVLGLTDTIIGKVFTDYRGIHTYKVQGYNAVGDGTASNEIEVTLTALTALPLPAPTISGNSAINYSDSIEATVLKGTKLKASYVPGAKIYQWYQGTNLVGSAIDLTIFSDSALFEGPDGKSGIIDSLLTCVATYDGGSEGEFEYYVSVANDYNAGEESLSASHTVALYKPALHYKDKVSKLYGTWSAQLPNGGGEYTAYDSLSTGNVIIAPLTYTLKIDSVNATTIAITSDFGIFGDTARILATVDLTTQSISIASQQVIGKKKQQELPKNYSPAYISGYDGVGFAANAGKDLSVSLASTQDVDIASAPAYNLIITIDNYMLYRGNSSGGYIGHPVSLKPIATAANAVVWTKN
ncbi:hypothetical protein AGMMS4956_05560 [Bacteroidia bacterium]|nr:hypothetical protein AGMMS4956_05560 [Bacteroidia bacterium]